MVVPMLRSGSRAWVVAITGFKALVKSARTPIERSSVLEIMDLPLPKTQVQQFSQADCALLVGDLPGLS